MRTPTRVRNLQVQVAVQGQEEHLAGCNEGVEGPRTEGDGGVKLEVHAICGSLQGLKAEVRERGNVKTLTPSTESALRT